MKNRQEGAVQRGAVISYHSSPLAAPGAGDSGGMTVYVREVAECLAQQGLATDIFTRASSGKAGVSAISPGVRVISVEAGPMKAVGKEELSSYIDDFVAGVRAFALMQRLEYDFVHSHYWQSGLAGKSLAAAWVVPLVHSHHTLGRVKNRFLAPGDEREPQSRIEGEHEVIAAADVLIASTDHEWEHLACLYGAPHDRLKTLHPGVDHRVFHPGDRRAARASLGLSDEIVMLYAGRIQRLKGLELAIRSVEQLMPALDRELVFLVVGGASGARGDKEVRRLQALSRSLGVERNVRFLGPQPHERLAEFYRAADAVTVCSHSESFGLVALEAHACGTPVVGTAVGGLSYVVRDGLSGWLVDTRDPAVFAARLKTLLADDELRRSFSDAAARAAAAFSWDRTACSLYDLYECLLRERAPNLCTC